jgi:hypothetical protein
MSRPISGLPRGTALCLLALAASLPAWANWTASGVFKYQDREQDATGFSGVVSEKPIRFADVEVLDPNKSGSKTLLAKGRTDANGAFSIAVTDSSVRTVRVRVYTRTTSTSDLFVKTVTQGGSYYAGSSPDVTSHNPNTSVSFGTMVATVGNGGGAFNIFDQAVLGADFVKALKGSRPSQAYAVKWQGDGGVTVSGTSGSTTTLRDNGAYDDMVILHEWAHYVMNNYSKSSNAGGTHYLSDCDEDLRLSFDEGRATSFGLSVRRYFGMPLANIYVRTDGASGPGHALNGYNLEDAIEYPCTGDTSEVSISRTIWDICDSAATTDSTPGVEDPQDRLALPDAEVWQVYTGPIKSATYVTDESFWDGWFDPTVSNGYFSEMKDDFGLYSIEFWEDAFEPNNTVSQATPLTVNGNPLHLTYFSDPDGNHKGQADLDVFGLQTGASVSYTIETLNLLSDANTYLEILDTNGTTVLASNDDRATGDPSSRIVWTAPRNGVFYVRSKHASDYGIYGSYDLRVTSP